ncbi:hypothetical protein PR001_g19514 [Phytophthora rubi]|uniref:Uncharacterized protein n=1 Tax=Phytophthora rubi TaxID=129364 RepID=A0A6A3JV96_9STRA|nr:hypothetical protein PR001_g19514 [Phytophthora rubi]
MWCFRFHVSQVSVKAILLTSCANAPSHMTLKRWVLSGQVWLPVTTPSSVDR